MTETTTTTISDDMCRAAIEAGKPDRIQGFTYEINGQVTHVVRDLTKPVGDSAHKLWVGSSHPEMMERCAIERMRLQLAAALAAPSPAPAAPTAAQPDYSHLRPEGGRFSFAYSPDTELPWVGWRFDDRDAAHFFRMELDALRNEEIFPAPAQPSQGGSVSERHPNLTTFLRHLWRGAERHRLSVEDEFRDLYDDALAGNLEARQLAELAVNEVRQSIDDPVDGLETLFKAIMADLSAARASAPAATEVPILWCVHHIGPDDLHPVENYERAIKLSDAINDQSEKFNFGHKPDSINYVYSRAYPAIWTGTPESHAEWLEKRRTAGEAANG